MTVHEEANNEAKEGGGGKEGLVRRKNKIKEKKMKSFGGKSNVGGDNTIHCRFCGDRKWACYYC